MRNNKHLITIFLFLAGSLVLSVRGIQAQGFVFDPGDTVLMKSAESFDFKGKFAARYASDEKNRYYLVDFSKFSNWFEKVFFMNLVFSEQKIVNIDGDIAKNQVWFLSSDTYPETDIIIRFEQFEKASKTKAAEMSQSEMDLWLKQNDKYKEIRKP